MAKNEKINVGAPEYFSGLLNACVCVRVWGSCLQRLQKKLHLEIGESYC